MLASAHVNKVANIISDDVAAVVLYIEIKI